MRYLYSRVIYTVGSRLNRTNSAYPHTGPQFHTAKRPCVTTIWATQALSRSSTVETKLATSIYTSSLRLVRQLLRLIRQLRRFPHKRRHIRQQPSKQLNQQHSRRAAIPRGTRSHSASALVSAFPVSSLPGWVCTMPLSRSLVADQVIQ